MNIFNFHQIRTQIIRNREVLCESFVVFLFLQRLTIQQFIAAKTTTNVAVLLLSLNVYLDSRIKQIE